MAVETTDWDSDPAGMMRVYQGQNYDLGQSIADLVDNGIDEGANKVEILIVPGETEKELFIAIFDDGSGIQEGDFDDIMKLGHSKKTDATKLGVFGVGLKLSSLAQADEVTIVSGVQGAAKNLRRISAPFILKHNQNKLMTFPKSDSSGRESAAYELCYKKMIDEDWSTFILLEEIHARDQFVAINENFMTSLSKEYDRVLIHLGLTFHRIIKKGDVEITLGTGDIESQPIKALHPAMPEETDLDFGTVSSKIQTIAYDSDEANLNVPVEYIILPHTKTVQKKSSLRINKGYKRANDMQGLYIYRNDRLIQYGNWQGMFTDVGRNDEHNKLGKIFIDIPSDYIKLFGLNPTKTEVKLPKEFLRRLLIDSKKPRKWGNIHGGKELTFSEAFDKRYRSEGKAFKKRQEQGTNPSSISSSIKEGPADTPGVSITDPASRVRQRKKSLKPKRIIESIEEGQSTLILELSGTPEERRNFLEVLREWHVRD